MPLALLLSLTPETKSQHFRVCRFDFKRLSVFQENFELYHETLYLAVKITDHYLSQTPVHREMLQLVGSTAMLIASKFEVRIRALIDQSDSYVELLF